MYKITKTINGRETINLVFDDNDDNVKAKEVFSDLQYDEFVRFREMYGNEFNKKTMGESVNGKSVYKEYTISTPTFSVTIILRYTKD